MHLLIGRRRKRCLLLTIGAAVTAFYSLSRWISGGGSHGSEWDHPDTRAPCNNDMKFGNPDKQVIGERLLRFSVRLLEKRTGDGVVLLNTQLNNFQGDVPKACFQKRKVLGAVCMRVFCHSFVILQGSWVHAGRGCTGCVTWWSR